MDFSLQTLGAYKFSCLIGSGSFAQVYRATHIPSSLQVAIKVMRCSEINLAQREVNFTFFLRHPNIIQLLDCFQGQGYAFIVLELCENDLFVSLTAKSLTAHHRRDLITQVMSGVEYCHGNNIYHHDLKPENILLSANFTVRIADFGLATTQTVSTGLGCGSLRYLAPEALVREGNYAYSPAKNDVWALGVLLLNILTARNPWHVACLSDPCYALFINDKRSLQEAFGLSNELYYLLLDVFVDEAARIGVREFKKRFDAILWLSAGDSPFKQNLSILIDDAVMNKFCVDECMIRVDSPLDTPSSPVTPTLMFDLSLDLPLKRTADQHDALGLFTS